MTTAAFVIKLALAIHHINPMLPQSTVREFASEVALQADRHALDPWLIIELVHRETHWIPSLVRHEKDGTCSVGLGQINVQCRDVKPFLEPHANLRRTAFILNRLRERCKLQCAGSSWLAGYNRGSHGYATSILTAASAHHHTRHLRD
jgi:hypothetical protein